MERQTGQNYFFLTAMFMTIESIIGSIVQLAHRSRANHNMLIPPKPAAGSGFLLSLESDHLNNRNAFQAWDFEQAFFKISYVAREGVQTKSQSVTCADISNPARASHSGDSGLYFSQLSLILKDLIGLW